MMRNTSPVGWPIVLAIKIWRDRSLLSFLMAGLLIFMPVVFICIGIDSYYFGEFPVITSYNFMQANITEGLSKYYGVEPPFYYLFVVIPFFFTTYLPLLIPGLYFYPRDHFR